MPRAMNRFRCPKDVYRRSLEKFDVDATTRARIVRWLRHSWLFHDWSRSRLIGLASKLEEREYRCRAALVTAGQTAPGLILITRGEVKVIKQNAAVKKEAENQGRSNGNGKICSMRTSAVSLRSSDSRFSSRS